MGKQFYIGPAVWVRIKHRFGARQMEWFMAAMTAAWGAVLLLPAETFTTSPGWVIFRSFWSEEGWGIIMLLLGLVRLFGLYVNGARADVTPWIRISSAMLGFMVWVGICTSFGLSGIISTWLAIYPLFAIAEIVNIIRAGRDVGESEYGKSNT